MIIKDTQIQSLSLQITKIIDTSSKSDNIETQLTGITSKVSAYEVRLDKLRTANINNIDTSMKEHEEMFYFKLVI